MKMAKGAVVTGAAGGIGTSLCEELNKAGYLVWAVDQNEVGLKNLADARPSASISRKILILERKRTTKR